MAHDDERAPTDSELMARVRFGDEGAFEQIYRRHAQSVFAYLWRRLGDEALAADLRQEAFLRLWRARRSWTPTGSLRSYLIGVARGLAIDAHRHERVRARKRDQIAEHLGKAPPAPDAELGRRRLAARLQAALADLPPRTAEVFSLKGDAGMTYREIAEMLGISPKTVEVHMSRAFRKLREALADLREPRRD